MTFGALKSKKDIREYRVSSIKPNSIEIPNEFELPMPEVKNQYEVGACHDDQTKVLTKKGWKFFKDITYDDELASVNPNDGKLIFEKPTNILNYDYNGEMIVGKHRSMDFKVTPNHKMVVRTFNSQTKHLNDNYEFVEAGKLGWWNGFRTDFHHTTDKDEGYIVFEEEKFGNGRILPRLEIDMHLWVQFLGIYLAEGCFDKDGEKYHFRIQLAAVKDRERNYIKQLLSDMGLHVGDCYRDRFFIYNKRVRNKLVEYGLLGVRSYDKFVPDFIFDLDEIYIKEFLYGFSMGDGLARKNGVVHYYTSSERLAEQLEMLILMSGHNAKIIKSKWKNPHLVDDRIISTKHQAYVICSKINPLSINRQHNITKEHYNGKVYCAEVPTYHTLITKRNGNILLSGNCVAHSIATIVEYFNSLQEGNNKAFSTGYIYGNRRNTDWTGTGMYVDKAINAVVKWGDVYNEKFNYNIEVPDAIAKFEEQAFDLAPDAYPHRFSEFYRLDTDEERKLHLMQYGPIVFSIAWYKDYYVDKKTKVLTHLSNEIAGYHCMVIYGWNELGWKFQNSWGTTFGNRGRAILPYNTEFDTCYGIKDNISSHKFTEEIESMKALIETLETELSEKENQLEEYQQSTETTKKQINELKKQITNLQLALDSANTKLENLEQLQNELMEIKRPFEKMPSWLANIINYIINLFK